jgi:hypothetical protein
VDIDDKIEEALNAEGRSRSHVALGLLICLGCVGATAAIAASRPQPPAPGARVEKKSSPLRAIWPALFSVTTLAAVRVWNAPSSPQRTRALGLWGGLQGLNVLWMILGPRDKVTRIVAGLSTAGMTALYARAASDVDAKAASLVAPAIGGSLAALVATPARG